jgi:cell division septal protein FtsQ
VRFPRVRRKKADKKAEALAAGTVAPEAVFVAGDGTGEGGEPGEVGAADTTSTATAVNGTAGTGPAPVTAPVPSVGAVPAAGGAPTGGDPLPPPAPKLRFGFDTGEHALPPPSAATAGVGQHTAAVTGTRTGEVAVTAAPRKVVTIGFDADLEQLETTTFDPSPVDLPLPGVDPRMRARRIQVRRDEGRRRLRWAVIGGAGVAVLLGAGLVLESPFFAVNDVEVTGAVYTDPARLAEVVDDLDGSTLLGADLGKAEATLAADPWVKRVRVERRLLRGVRIEIVERIPVTTYMGEDQRWRVLDAEGKVMAVLDPPGSKPVDPLELTLATPGPDLEPGATAPAALAGAAGVVPRLPSDLRSRTCSLAVSEQGRLQLHLCDGFVIDLGSPDRLRDKLVTTIFVLNTRTEEVEASSGLDVGDPERPVLIQK